jgi:glutamate--cysteine ligase
MTPPNTLLKTLKENSEKINLWLSKKEATGHMPFYSSVDIRDAGFKIASVDTNLFPAGFNNLSHPFSPAVIQTLREAILKRVPNCKSILFISEEHTRNTWYLENVRILNKMIKEAGFEVKTASFLSEDATPCTTSKSVTLETATGHPLQIYCLHHILTEVDSSTQQYDLIILNNDLTDGIPEILKKTNIPIYPSIQAGWHSRLKTHHFREANKVIAEFCALLNIDPWHLSCLFKTSPEVDINEDEDRTTLHALAVTLFDEIKAKYHQYGITEKPFIFLKADHGTYGMGVIPIEDPDDILTLNRKERNKLHKGKGAKVIERFILQEGIPSISQIDDQVSEVCIYQIANHYVGGFYRLNNQKNNRENLNSQGMSFKTICLPSQIEKCEGKYEENIDAYQIIARLSGIAAKREIDQLETQ